MFNGSRHGTAFSDLELPDGLKLDELREHVGDMHRRPRVIAPAHRSQESRNAAHRNVGLRLSNCGDRRAQSRRLRRKLHTFERCSPLFASPTPPPCMHIIRILRAHLSMSGFGETEALRYGKQCARLALLGHQRHRCVLRLRNALIEPQPVTGSCEHEFPRPRSFPP
jgi:hypothetical protein